MLTPVSYFHFLNRHNSTELSQHQNTSDENSRRIKASFKWAKNGQDCFDHFGRKRWSLLGIPVLSIFMISYKSQWENFLVLISFMRSRLLKGRPVRNFPFQIQTSCFYHIREEGEFFSRVFSLGKVFSHVHISHQGKCVHQVEAKILFLLEGLVTTK